MKKMNWIIKLPLLFIMLTLSAVNAKEYLAELNYIYSIRQNDVHAAKQHLDKLEKEYNRFTEFEKAKFTNLRAHSEAMYGNFQKSLEFSKKVPSITKNYDLRARAKSLETLVLAFVGNYQESFLGIYNLIDNLEKIKDQEVAQGVMQNALGLHVSARILDKAQELARQAIALAKRNNNKFYECHGNLELAQLSIELKQYNQAKADIKYAKSICKYLESPLQKLVIDAESAHILQGTLELKKALKSYLLVYDQVKSYGWRLMLLDSEVHLSEILLDLKEYDRVEKYALSAYEFSKESNTLDESSKICKILARFYKETNNPTKAKFYRDEYYRAAEELNGQLQRKRIAYYQAMVARADSKMNGSSQTTMNP